MSAGRLELFELRRLLHQVTVTDSNCWEWRTLDHKGYGKVKHDGKTGGAHRYEDYGYAKAPLCRVCGGTLTSGLHAEVSPPIDPQPSPRRRRRILGDRP